jgi:hypothetical protein
MMKSRPIDDMSTNVDMKLSLGDGILDFANYYDEIATTDLSWLRESEFYFSSNYKNEDVELNANISLNGEGLLSVKSILDMLTGQIYIQIPELTQSYMGIDVSESLQSGNLTLELQRNLPETAEMERLLQKYLDLAIENIYNVEKSSETLEVEGISQRCTTLTVTIDERDLQRIAGVILVAMLEDAELERIVDDLSATSYEIITDAYDMGDGNASFEAIRESYRDRVEKALEKVRNNEDFDDDKMVMTLWIDNRGEVRGRYVTLTSTSEDITEVVKSYYYMPQRGNDFGYEAGIISEENTMRLLGSGQYAGEKISGTFTLRSNGEEMFDITVRDFDMEEAKKGYTNGRFTIAYTPSAQRNLIADNPGVATNIIASLSLQLDIKSARDNYQTTATILDEQGVLFAALDTTVTISNGQSVRFPNMDDIITISDTSGLIEWALTIDSEAVIEDLRNRFDFPEEIMEQIEGIFSILNYLSMFY